MVGDPHPGPRERRMKKMKWNNPHQWLNDHIKHRAASRTVSAWLRITRLLVHALDADTIQHLFQEEMEKDGYFDE